jgi:hypothetical protein
MSQQHYPYPASSLAGNHRAHSIGRLFNWEQGPMEFLFSHKRLELRLSPEELKKDALGFSHGEQILIHAALDLWCSQGDLKLLDALEVLDEDLFLNLICACLDFRELSPEDIQKNWNEAEQGLSQLRYGITTETGPTE